MKLPKNYIVERRAIKHARIRVSENLSVRILVPSDFSDAELKSLINHKQSWIDRNLRRFVTKPTPIKIHSNQLLLFGNRYNYFFNERLHHKVVLNHDHKTIQSKTDLLEMAEQLKWYKRFARTYLKDRVAELAKQYKFKYNKVFIREQRTKWGNCSIEKNISLNWKLIKTPPFVIDYLIVHELLHTRNMSHKKTFWQDLKGIMPDYAEAVQWLDKYGNAL